MTWLVPNLWLIPALPLAAAAVTALATRPQRRFAATLAIGSMILAFVLSCVAFASTLGAHTGVELERQVYNFNWFQFGDTWLKLGWVLDPLTAIMLVMVTLVGTLIFIYSKAYMAQDENFTRFFCFMSLFAAAMLGLIIANSLLLLFICWELVGLSSYLLIGFWYHKPSAAAAAKKAFIVTRVGDIGFFLGILWLYATTRTLLFYDGGNGCLEQDALTRLVAQTTGVGIAVSTGISLLIFCGAIGKSGQVPLHVWLPDAMEGPTPVSALIHAATMVAAGVFLVARVYPLMTATPENVAQASSLRVNAAFLPRVTPVESGQTLSPSLALSGTEREKPATVQGFNARNFSRNSLPGEEGRGEGERLSEHHTSAVTSTALKVVTWIGAITAVFAALIAVAQTDIKRILAYSTVSQLGYMMMGLGVGGVPVGMFHLITHAFFKALLFLGAGSVIHGCHEEQDIRRMGGLRKFMPVTFATYAVGMMALCGVPILFSGFWSKDEILHAAWLWQPSKWPFALGVGGAFLTAFYMTRQVCHVFFGSHRSRARESAEQSSHSNAANPPSHDGGYDPHESPAIMTVPLVVLAAFAVLLGFIGTPAWPWCQQYLGAPHDEVAWGGVVTLMLISTGVVFAGISIAGVIYGLLGTGPITEKDVLETLAPSIFAVLRDKFYVDELYEATVVRLNAAFARFCHWLDSVLLDTLVVVVSHLVLGLSWVNRVIDEYVVNLGFDQTCERLRRGGGFLSRLQDGQVQNYLRVLGLALTVFLLLLTWGCGK